MPINDYESICNSIKRGTRNGEAWNHLCTLPVDHLGRHECWSGYGCANWTEEESDGRAPSAPPRTYLKKNLAQFQKEVA